MINRVIRAAMLDGEFFKEAEADTSLTQEALMVVILVAIAGSIGNFIGTLMNRSFGAALVALIGALIIGVLNYYVWSYVTYFVGRQLFNAAVDPGELLRVLGYASGPRVLGVLRFIPCLGWPIAFAGDIWALIAGFIGAKEAVDLDATKTLITVAIGWVIIVIISFIIGAVFGVGAAGLGAVSSLLGGS